MKNTDKDDRAEFISNNDFNYEELASIERLRKLHLWGFKLLLKGRNEDVTKLMFKKVNNLDVFIFEYKYQGIFDGTSEYGTTFSTQQAVYYELEKKQNISFNLYPEGLIEKAKQSIFSNDIDFDDYPLFSRSYALYGEDEKSIRNLFSKPLFEFFEKYKGFSVEYRRGGVLIYKNGDTPNKDLKDLLKDATFINDQFSAK